MNIINIYSANLVDLSTLDDMVTVSDQFGDLIVEKKNDEKLNFVSSCEDGQC